YGNGCSSSMSAGGSSVSCSSRIVESISPVENQKIGTYYNFQAATDGTGAAVTTENANSPDTFCPLGWQLPYSGTGGDYYDKSRSWKYLFTSYSILSDQAGFIALRSYPLQIVVSGFFGFQEGRTYSMGGSGAYQTSSVVSSLKNYRIVTYAAYINASSDNKTLGNTIRRVNNF
ncbi:hypothetical protein IKE07_02280, partial [Candidatus Saccharibacteria bacterium]|nr:hypothetical protein [Candidatus Saccharibacteria bacterium]